jgi:hypothetical protein
MVLDKGTGIMSQVLMMSVTARPRKGGACVWDDFRYPWLYAATACHRCGVGVPGDGRKVSLTLKSSNHYEPNDRYHMNIRKRPVWNL